MFFNISTSYIFLLSAIRDVNRQMFLLQQTIMMINHRKETYNFEAIKYIPTINIIESDTIEVYYSLL